MTWRTVWRDILDERARNYGSNHMPSSNEFAQWARAIARPTRIALTRIGRVEISTVQFTDGQYETCVFGGTYDHETERYGTHEDAERGHDMWVGRVTRDHLPKQRLIRE